jgi:hypothetical protein
LIDQRTSIFEDEAGKRPKYPWQDMAPEVRLKRICEILARGVVNLMDEQKATEVKSREGGTKTKRRHNKRRNDEVCHERRAGQLAP